MDENENEEQTEGADKPQLLGMIMSPVEQFERIKKRPVIWMPLIIITVLTILVSFMTLGTIDFSGEPGMEDADFSEDELQMIKIVGIISGAFVSLVVPIFSITVSSLIFLLAAKIVKSPVKFKELFSMNTFVYVIGLFGAILNGIIFLLAGGSENAADYTSLNSLVDMEGPLGSLLAELDIFNIWMLILSAIGLHIVGRFSKKAAWSVMIILFILTAGIGMIGEALSMFTADL